MSLTWRVREVKPIGRCPLKKSWTRIGKRPTSAVELVEHSQWAAVNSQGVRSDKGLCLTRTEVRQFELDQIARLIEHCAC